MGYDTSFKGYLKLSKPLTKKQQRWFNDWKEIRKVFYDSDKLKEHYKGVGSLDGDYGENGEFFGYIPSEVTEEYENTYDWNIIVKWRCGDHPEMFPIKGKHNDTPSNQPSLWCKWMIEGDKLFYDTDKERFYGYVDWITYINDKILKKWGIKFEEGYSIKWSGEDVDDVGEIHIDEDGNPYTECW